MGVEIKKEGPFTTHYRLMEATVNPNADRRRRGSLRYVSSWRKNLPVTIEKFIETVYHEGDKLQAKKVYRFYLDGEYVPTTDQQRAALLQNIKEEESDSIEILKHEFGWYTPSEVELKMLKMGRITIGDIRNTLIEIQKEEK